jgi:hypothetical protein
MYDLTNTLARRLEVTFVIRRKQIVPSFFIGGLEITVVLSPGIQDFEQKKQKNKAIQVQTHEIVYA